MYIYQKQKNKGYILVEYLTSMFIFLILISVLSMVISSVVGIRNRVYTQYEYNENMKIMERIIKSIKDRDSYEDNIFIEKNILVFKKDKKIIKYEFKKPYLYISDSDDGKNFGLKIKLIKCDDVLIYEKGGILKIKTVFGDKSIERLVYI